MKKNDIEDIYIGERETTPKKGKKVFVIFFIILVLILIGMIGAYFYFSNKTITEKQAFVNSLSNTNIKKFSENNIYEEISNRLLQENSETTTTMKFSTTEQTEGIDFSNFEFNLKNNNDIDTSKSYAELGVNYSGNEIFKIKLLSTEKEIAISSDEIVTRYVGVHYNKLNEVFGIDFNEEDLEKISKSEKIDLSSEEKETYTQKYLTKIFEQIPGEKFTKQDNIAITKDGNSVNVVAHKLTLSQDELKNVLTTTLTELRNDDELLKKLVTGNDAEKNKDEENTIINSNREQTENSEETNTTEPVPMPSFENTQQTINIYEITDSSEEQLTQEEGTENNFNSSITIDTNDQEDSVDQLEVTPVQQIDIYNTVSDIENENTENDDVAEFSNSNESLSTIDALLPIMLGIKADTTVDNIKSQIDDLINQIKKLEGDGLTVNIYASDEATEKISVILPNGNTLDIEFTKKSDNENTIKLTYLFETENLDDTSSNEMENGVITYSAEDEINASTDTKGNVKKDGLEITLNNISNEASNTLKVSCNIIEEEAINQKIELELKTDGNKTSNDIKNNIVFGMKTNESEYKILIDNSIKFSTNPEIEDLTSENCVFLDELSEEEREATINAIIEKTISVYNDKKENLSFFDTNVDSSIIQQNLQTVSTTVTKEEARNALIKKFQSLYQEAQDNGQEFTLHNLDNLEIEGLKVSTNITDEMAVIVIDTYTFKINSNFELLEE